MDRKPRAPVLRANALRAIAFKAAANLQLHTFHGEELAVLFDERVLEEHQ